MNIITLGRGFVADHLPYEVNPYRIAPDDRDVATALGRGKPDVIINCIGKTGRPNVDWCETHQAETYTANVVLPLMIADWCERHNVHLINIGSGCIYFGESPNHHYLQGDGTPWPDRMEGAFVIPGIKVDDGWRETDFANPKSFYSKTKYATDLVIGGMKNVTTLRIRMPISEKNAPRNLINKLRGYRQIINLPNSMTFMSDLIRCIDWAVLGNKTGIYHATNPEPLTAVQIMTEFQKYCPEHTFDILYNEQQLDAITVAKRSNSILDSSKLHAAGFQMTNSQEALQTCMAAYIKNL